MMSRKSRNVNPSLPKSLKPSSSSTSPALGVSFSGAAVDATANSVVVRHGVALSMIESMIFSRSFVSPGNAIAVPER